MTIETFEDKMARYQKAIAPGVQQAMTMTTRASLALALHQYLRAAEDEVGKARTKRDEEIRHLYAEGMSGHQIAELLGLTPRSIYNVVNAGEKQ